jgi:hypothetical protein
VLAVKVDYETRLATVGTKPGSVVPTTEILAAIESLGYRGELFEQPL